MSRGHNIPLEARAAWTSVLELSSLMGRAAAAAADPQADALADFSTLTPSLIGDLRQLSELNFPVDSYSARECAKAFLIVARLFVNPQIAPEARTACAGLLLAAAECLGDAMSRLRAAESQVWRGRQGGDD